MNFRLIVFVVVSAITLTPLEVRAAATYNAVLSPGSSVTAMPTAYTWTGNAGDGNFATAGNWWGGVVPGTSNTAIFDYHYCKNHCNVALNANISVAGVQISTAYPGTLTQLSGKTLTVGSSGWIQGGGTFSGGDSAITVNGVASITGGSFISTSGTFTIYPPNVSSTATVIFFQVASVATFSHNYGTFNLKADAGHVGDCSVLALTLDVPGGQDFYNFRQTYSGNNYCSDTFLKLVSGRSINVRGNFTHGSTYLHLNQGTFYVYGNLTNSNVSANGNPATIVMTGTANQTYTGSNVTSVQTANLVINKTSGTVTQTSSSIMAVPTLTLTQGSISMAGSPLWVKTTLSMSAGTSITLSGGTLTVNGATVGSGSYGSGTINP